VLLGSKILLNCLEAMVFLDVINHSGEMIIVFGLACSVVTATEQMRIGWLRGCRSSVFLIVEVPYKINAKCDHLVAFFKVVSNAEMRAASTTAKNEIEIVSQDDENNSGKFFEPFHLAHKLTVQRKIWKKSHNKVVVYTSMFCLVRKCANNVAHLIDVSVVLREVEVQTQYA